LTERIQTQIQTVKGLWLGKECWKSRPFKAQKGKRISGENLSPIRSFCMVVVLAGTLGIACARAQEPASALPPSHEDTVGRDLDDGSLLTQNSQPSSAATDKKPTEQNVANPKFNPADLDQPGDQPSGQNGKQSKRILWIIPNYRTVSANTHLPPLTLKGKFWLATEDTVDYSNFIFVGALAGISMVQKSQPTFGQGGVGYGRYYWHIFVDGAIENYMVEAILPVVTKEDPRYYTLGKGGFLKRTGYAISQLFITRNNAGNNTFNFSEIVGSGAAAGIGNVYYPPQSNPLVKTYQRWGTQIALDGVFNILKEFWPDIDQKVFHGKY
jgi:hypothetical protein